MAYKVLTKQQWDSLPSYKKNQMRARTPDLYNYYQDRYVPKAEPVAKKDTGGMLSGKRTAPWQTVGAPIRDSGIGKGTSVAVEGPALSAAPTGSMERTRVVDPIGSVGNAPKGWWDVADPKAFFGVQGDRNATQQANADRFIKEWEEVSDNSRTSRSTLNGLIDGTYDASLVADNWGSNTSLSGLEQVKSYSDTIGEYGGDFGAYLRQEWDNFNTSQGVDLGGLNTSPTIGTVASDGPSGRASIETPARLSMQSYVDAISSAAQEAGTPLKASLPDGSMYELNYGQFDDVALGAYKQTQEPMSTATKNALKVGKVFASVIQSVLLNAVGGALKELAGISAPVGSTPAAPSSNGTIWNFTAENTGAVITNGEEVSSFLGSLIDVVTDPRLYTESLSEINEELDTGPSEVPEDIIVDDAAADLEAEQAAAAEEAYRLEQQEAARVAAEQEAARIAEAEAERQRVAAEEAEATRLAEEKAEAARVAAEAEAERQRVAAEEAEAARVAAEEAAEEARLAEEAEAERQRVAAAEAEARRVAAAEAS